MTDDHSQQPDKRRVRRRRIFPLAEWDVGLREKTGPPPLKRWRNKVTIQKNWKELIRPTSCKWPSAATPNARRRFVAERWNAASA